MNTHEIILHENRVQANKFAAAMLLCIAAVAVVAISIYVLGFPTEIARNYLVFLLGASAVGFSAWIGTAAYIITRKGEGEFTHHLIIADLLLAGFISSYILRVNINWPMFVLCVLYTIRYSEPKFTVRTGVVTSIAIIVTQFSLIPYGLATGYMNLNFVELDSDQILSVKEGSFGIFKAIVENGHINMGYVYSEAAIELLFPMVVYIAFIFICYHIAKYNLNHIMEQSAYETQINDALRKANSANEAKTTFLNSMSHDIRTPMNAIIGYSELLSKGGYDEATYDSYINNIKISSYQLMDLINNVLETSRIESGKLELDEKPIDVYKFISDIAVMMDSAYKEKNLNVVRDFDLKYRYILVDKSKGNIISNSIKYTPEGGSIYITIKDYESEIPGVIDFVATIQDTGRGMSEDFLPHIFEDFSREETSTQNAVTGTGLGMGIVKKLVTLMNGTIEVESELNKGTKVTLNIPVKVAKESDVVANIISSSDVCSLSGKRVLLAEDNALNAEIIKDILDFEGVIVEHANDGDVCLDMLIDSGEDYYDLILMDFQMPRMNGIDATKRIRALADRKKANIPIIAMTANAFESDRRHALAAGMDGFVSKPIDVDYLKQTINDVLSRKELR